MRVVCLVSGGKDSIFTLWMAIHQYEVSEILTVRSDCPDSLLYHLPNSQYVVLIAKMVGIPHREIWIKSCDLEEEIKVLKEALDESCSEAVITGGILSDFQRYKFNCAAELAEMKCFNPLWRISPNKIMLEMLNNGFRIIFSSVAGMGLGKDLLGQEITHKFLNSLKKMGSEFNSSIIGEGGDYESFVIDAPFFPSKIGIVDSKIHWDIHREEGVYEIIEVQLIPK